MSLLDNMDEVGKEVQLKREERKAAEVQAEKAKEEVRAEEKQHQLNKEQGMI
ncbi:MAG TPA: hypothetical protein VLF59_01750 [Candidatus Saccharimonadales bacterium]|nr:hypothetical protein [Candidatus Saccharimonadales bacterium]